MKPPTGLYEVDMSVTSRLLNLVRQTIDHFEETFEPQLDSARQSFVEPNELASTYLTIISVFASRYGFDAGRKKNSAVPRICTVISTNVEDEVSIGTVRKYIWLAHSYSPLDGKEPVLPSEKLNSRSLARIFIGLVMDIYRANNPLVSSRIAGMIHSDLKLAGKSVSVAAIEAALAASKDYASRE